MEEAIQEAPEGTTVEDSQEVAEETAPEGDAPEGTTDKDSAGETQTGSKPRSADDVDREWKSQYTRKTQEFAAQQRLKETELGTLKTQLGQLNHIVETILKDPSKISEYQRAAGVQGTKEAPKIETVEDLQKYIDHMREEIRNEVVGEMRNVSVSEVEKAQRHARWEGANMTMRQDPFFKKYETVVTSLIEKTPELFNAYDGNNEMEVYQKGVEYYRSLLAEDMDKAKAQTLEDQKKKKAAATIAPKKTVSTTSQKAGRSMEQTLAAISARLAKK